MEICGLCGQKDTCRIPEDFARFERVGEHLAVHGGPAFLRDRLEAFLHINHCVAVGELDLIHHRPDPDLNKDLPAGTHVDRWGIPDAGKARMIELRRNGHV